jgi:phosphoglycolate phosphatase
VDLDKIGDLDRAVLDFRALYAKCLLDTTRPYPGMAELLGRLVSTGTRLAVVTNKPEDLSRRILDGLGLADRFDLLLGGESLPVRKPDPAPLLHALATIGVSTSNAAMVGDSEIDIEASRAAGVPVAAVTWGFVAEARLIAARPDHISRDAADLEDWLTRG